MYSELLQECRAWGATVRAVVNSIDDDGSTRPDTGTSKSECLRSTFLVIYGTVGVSFLLNRCYQPSPEFQRASGA